MSFGLINVLDSWAKPNSYLWSVVAFLQSGEFVPILPYQFSGLVSFSIKALVCVCFCLNSLLKFLCFNMARCGNPIPPKVQDMNDYERDLEITDLRRTVDLLQRQLEQ